MSLERPEISTRDCGVQKSEQRCDRFITQLPDGALDEAHRLLTCDNMFIIDHRSLSLQSAPVRTALFHGKTQCRSWNINYRHHPALHELLIIAVSVRSPVTRTFSLQSGYGESGSLLKNLVVLVPALNRYSAGRPCVCEMYRICSTRDKKMHPRIFTSQVWINCTLHLTTVSEGRGGRVCVYKYFQKL